MSTFRSWTTCICCYALLLAVQFVVWQELMVMVKMADLTADKEILSIMGITFVCVTASYETWGMIRVFSGLKPHFRDQRHSGRA